MGDHYGDESQSASDQEELVGETDLEDDFSETEEMQFSFCKTSVSFTDQNLMNSKSSIVTNADYKLDTNHPTKSKLIFCAMVVILFLSAFLLIICFPLYLQQLNVNVERKNTNSNTNIKSTIHNNNNTINIHKFNNNNGNNNAYGALLFISTLITSIFLFATLITSWTLKWDIKLYKFPLPWKRLVTIATVSGLSGTLCTICSYQRVPCHLQDPLKGFALAFSILFYFFFCKKMMGLQKIFSATTAVVGLFISVDYGLCDEFRCRGINIEAQPLTPANVGWQGRAVWTILYIIGLALWTLHLTLLEGDIVTINDNLTSMPTNKLLTTVSRIVSTNTEQSQSSDIQKPIKRKPKALHVAMWIHIISLFITITFGWMDLMPGTGSVIPLNDFWQTTGKTFLCHLNIKYNNVPVNDNKATLEFLSNLTPGSVLYNQTVQKLRRDKRQANDENHHRTKEHKPHQQQHYFHKRINTFKENLENLENDTVLSKIENFFNFNTSSSSSIILTKSNNSTILVNKTNHHRNHPSENLTRNSSSATTTGLLGNPSTRRQQQQQGVHVTGTATPVTSSSNGAQHRKINSDNKYYWKKYKNHIKYKHNKNDGSYSAYMSSNGVSSSSSSSSSNDVIVSILNSHNQTPIKISKLILNTSSWNYAECSYLMFYALLFVGIYVVFIITVFHFLFMTESAVFTVAVISATLPVSGIFWSLFELTTTNNVAKITWSPEITGELICSLLGTPIVILGLILFSTAHFNDNKAYISSSSSKSVYTSLSSAGDA